MVAISILTLWFIPISIFLKGILERDAFLSLSSSFFLLSIYIFLSFKDSTNSATVNETHVHLLENLNRSLHLSCGFIPWTFYPPCPDSMLMHMSSTVVILNTLPLLSEQNAVMFVIFRITISLFCVFVLEFLNIAIECVMYNTLYICLLIDCASREFSICIFCCQRTGITYSFSYMYI